MRLNFNKLLITTVIICSILSSQAFGQTVYGVIDVGYEHLSNSAKEGSVQRMSQITADRPSYFGFKGSEDINDELSITYKLEGGFTPTTGASLQGGRLFGRQATLGIKNQKLGELQFGRQWSMTFYTLLDSDVIGPSAFGLASLDSYIPNSRVDGALAYFGSIKDFRFGLSYSSKRDSQSINSCSGGAGKSCQAWSVMANYRTDRWGAGLAFDEIRGGKGASPITVMPGAAGVTFNSSTDKDQRYYANAFYKFDQFKLGGGIIYRNIDTRAHNLHTILYYLGVSVPIKQWQFDGQISFLENNAYSANAALYVLRTTYHFSKTTAAYISLAYMDNRGKNSIYSVSSSSFVPASTRPGHGQFGTLIGLRYVF